MAVANTVFFDATKTTNGLIIFQEEIAEMTADFSERQKVFDENLPNFQNLEKDYHEVTKAFEDLKKEVVGECRGFLVKDCGKHTARKWFQIPRLHGVLSKFVRVFVGQKKKTTQLEHSIETANRDLHESEDAVVSLVKSRSLVA